LHKTVVLHKVETGKWIEVFNLNLGSKFAMALKSLMNQFNPPP